MENAKTKFTSIAEYIASFPDDRQPLLEEIRTTIHAAAPGIEEKISYNMPTFTYHGRLVYFAAWKKHLALYGTPSEILDALGDEVAPYRTDKGALLFPFSKPFPFELLTKIVHMGVSKNLQIA